MTNEEKRKAQTMTPELKAAWIADLREHSELQGKNLLRDHKDQYCCLGRLCVIANLQWEYDDDHYIACDSRGNTTLPGGLGTYFGTLFEIPNHVEHKLIDMNDGMGEHYHEPKNFYQIADWIENNL